MQAQQQHRRQRHRDADDGGQLVAQLGVHQLHPGRFAEDHEGELAAQPQGAGQHQRAARVQSPRPAADAEQQRELDRQQGRHARGDQFGLRHHRVQVDVHADGDEEQAQQQALERVDLRFQLVAEFGIGQQHAGQERAQARAQAGQLHEPGDAQHHQQRGGGEHLGHARARDDAEQVAQHQPAAEDHDRDGADGVEHHRPGQRFVLRAAQQRDRGQQRDRHQVLEQQDGEAEPAVFAGQFLAFGQQLQADRGGRQGQAQADHQRGLPVMLEQQRDPAQQQRAQQYLQPAGAEHRLAHHPQARGRQLQADDEQHHHHTDLGGVEDAVGVAHQRQAIRAQHHAGHQIRQHRAQPEPLEHRHRDHRGQQEHQRQLKTTTVHASPRGDSMRRTGPDRPLPGIEEGV